MIRASMTGTNHSFSSVELIKLFSVLPTISESLESTQWMFLHLAEAESAPK